MRKTLYISRRSALGSLFCAVAVGSARGQLVDKDPYDLKPGEFTWHPERTGDGPLSIIVSIPEQRVFVYRNSIRVASSTCSTGRPGHATPAGVFTILQKDQNHHSSTYNDAPMPNMNRLTWSGVALHAGQLPGYPASHGCVRLPLEFSAMLFSITRIGTPVIIASAASQPAEVIHPGMFMSDYAKDEVKDAVAHLKNAMPKARDHEESPPPAVAVVISSADQRGSILENGKQVAEGRVYITDPATPLGSHVFMLVGPHDGVRGYSWNAVGYHSTHAAPMKAPDASIITRIKADPGLVKAMQARMQPGLTLVLTDEPASAVTRSSEGFTIMTTS